MYLKVLLEILNTEREQVWTSELMPQTKGNEYLLDPTRVTFLLNRFHMSRLYVTVEIAFRPTRLATSLTNWHLDIHVKPLLVQIQRHFRSKGLITELTRRWSLFVRVLLPNMVRQICAYVEPFLAVTARKSLLRVITVSGNMVPQAVLVWKQLIAQMAHKVSGLVVLVVMIHHCFTREELFIAAPYETLSVVLILVMRFQFSKRRKVIHVAHLAIEVLEN